MLISTLKNLVSRPLRPSRNIRPCPCTSEGINSGSVTAPITRVLAGTRQRLKANATTGPSRSTTAVLAGGKANADLCARRERRSARLFDDQFAARPVEQQPRNMTEELHRLYLRASARRKDDILGAHAGDRAVARYTTGQQRRRKA